MSAGQAKRSAAPKVSFAELNSSAGESDDDDGGEDGGSRGRRAHSSRAATGDDDDGLVLVAGGSGAAKRKQSSGGGRRKKPRSSGDDADGAAADGEGSSASSLVNSLKARYSRGDDSTPLSQMSSVSRRENATHLSYFEQLAQPARKSNNNLKDIPKLSEEVSEPCTHKGTREQPKASKDESSRALLCLRACVVCSNALASLLLFLSVTLLRTLVWMRTTRA